MKAFVFGTVLALATAGSLGAQTIGCARPGVVVTKGREDPRRGFARMQIEGVFNGITLTPEQRQKAEDIINTARDRSPGVAQANDEKHGTVMRDRNEQLKALVTSDADRGKVTENIAAMASSPNRCDVAR